jgi:hypothetical protein
MLKRLVFILGFISLTLYGSEGIAQSISLDGAIPNNLEISLQRTGCLGSCPVYSLNIKANGDVTFIGANTRVKGETASKISQEKIKLIIAEFERANFFKVDNNYTYTGSNCGSFMDDFPSEIITIKFLNLSKKVIHNFGCISSKEELKGITEVGKRIDEITESAKWIKPATGLRFPPKKKPKN